MNKDELLLNLRRIKELPSQTQRQISTLFVALVNHLDDYNQTAINDATDAMGYALGGNANYLEALLHIAQHVNPHQFALNQATRDDLEQHALPQPLQSGIGHTLANFLRDGKMSLFDIVDDVIQCIDTDPEGSLHHTIHGQTRNDRLQEPSTPPSRRSDGDERSMNDRMTAIKYRVTPAQLARDLPLRPLIPSLTQALEIYKQKATFNKRAHDGEGSGSSSSTNIFPKGGGNDDGSSRPDKSPAPEGFSGHSGSSTGR